MELSRILRNGSIYNMKVITGNKITIRKNKSKKNNDIKNGKKTAPNKIVEDLLEECKNHISCIDVGSGMKSAETVEDTKLKNDLKLSQVEEVFRRVKTMINSTVEKKNIEICENKMEIIIKIFILTNLITFSMEKFMEINKAVKTIMKNDKEVEALKNTFCNNSSMRVRRNSAKVGKFCNNIVPDYVIDLDSDAEVGDIKKVIVEKKMGGNFVTVDKIIPNYIIELDSDMEVDKDLKNIL